MESAPPEMATQMRSPGLICVRSKGSVGETDISMRIQATDLSKGCVEALFAHRMRLSGRLFVGWHWCERQCCGERCVEGLDSVGRDGRDTDPASSVT